MSGMNYNQRNKDVILNRIERKIIMKIIKKD